MVLEPVFVKVGPKLQNLSNQVLPLSSHVGNDILAEKFAEPRDIRLNNCGDLIVI
jgi:hypothetical protein